jgi:hypothetical protein
MQALPQKTTDYIAEQFRAYFDRKAQGGMRLREATAIIDYLSISGPAPGPTDSAAIDYARPRVSGGGGRTRPSEQRIENILNKYAVDENDAFWNGVFDALIRQYDADGDKKALKFIKLYFQRQLKPEEVWRRMGVSERTYKAYRLAILTRATVYAVSAGCTLDT